MQLDKFEDDITKIKEDVTLLVDKKQQVKEDYYEARYEHEVEAESIKYSEWIVKIKAQKAEYEKKKIEQLNARKQALADRPNPYQKEIDTADRLIQYCELLKRKCGLGPQTEELIKEETK